MIRITEIGFFLNMHVIAQKLKLHYIIKYESNFLYKSNIEI